MRKIIFVATVLFFFSFLFLYSTNLFSRAGGGHSYSGSSSRSSSSSHSSSRSSYSSSRSYSSGSSHSSGGSGAAAIFTLLVIGGIIAIIVYASRREPNAAKYDEIIGKVNNYYNSRMEELKSQALQKLKSIDPDFSEEQFILRVKQAFLTIQKGWSEQNMELMRSFVSNGIFARFSIQIDIQKAEGFRNQLDNIKILNAWIDTVYSDNLYDVINVGFNATMEDKNVDLKTGNVISYNTSEPFTEYWTFVRRKGAKTEKKAGLIEGRCPNCGSEIKITESGSCEYCKAFIMGGQYDWVLTEITQECEYDGLNSQVIIGLEEIIKKDPDFNAAVVEDKVSVMFFKMIGTLWFGTPRYIKGFTHPEYLKKLQETENFKPIFDEKSSYYPSIDEAAIGTVELKRVSLNGADGYDRAEVMVKWSGCNCERERATKKLRNKSTNTVRTQTYVLVRKSNIKSSAFYNFKTIPCHNCGAPLSDKVLDLCEFCGSPINDGTRDWVLYSIEPYKPFEYKTDKINPFGKNLVEDRILISAIISGMVVDGRIDEMERRILTDVAKSKGISEEEIKRIVESAMQGYVVGMPSNPDEAASLLEKIVQLFLMDGVLTEDEYKVANNVAERFGIDKGRLDKIISEQKKFLYKNAKAFIKNNS